MKYHHSLQSPPFEGVSSRKCDFPEVQVFNSSLLPDIVSRYCADVSSRLSAPTAYVMASTLCVLGAAIGCKCGIRPKLLDSWLVTPNVWALNVGEASAMKSPAMSQPLSLLSRVEQQIRHAARQPDYRLITNDATGEKIVRLLSENPHGLLMARDELSGLFEIWTRHGREAERALYLEAWNGTAPYSSDRVVSGTWSVKHLCLSVMGTIQPSKLARLLGGSGIEDGLAQRFQLLVFPEAMQRRFCDEPEDEAAKGMLESILLRLATADFRMLCGTQDAAAIPSLTFSRVAYERYKSWWQQNASRNDDPVLCSFTTKHERLVPALALIDHLTLSFSEGTPDTLAPVSLESIDRAIAQSDFFLSNVKRVLGMLLKRPEQTIRDALFSRLDSGQLVGGFSVRDVVRANWAGLTDPDAVRTTLAHLVAEGVLREIHASNPAGGRKTVRYEVLSTD